MAKISEIVVLGVGGVGELAATLLTETGFKVTGADVHRPEGELPFEFVTASAAAPDNR